MAEAASSDEDLSQVQDELRRLRLRAAGARRPQPTQRVGRVSSHVKDPQDPSLCGRLKEASVYVLKISSNDVNTFVSVCLHYVFIPCPPFPPGVAPVRFVFTPLQRSCRQTHTTLSQNTRTAALPCISVSPADIDV